MSKLMYRGAGPSAIVSGTFDDEGGVLCQRYEYGGNQLISLYRLELLDDDSIDDITRQELEDDFEGYLEPLEYRVKRHGLKLSKQEAKELIKWLSAVVESMPEAKNDLPNPGAPYVVHK
ncbi:hypothetical protein MYO4S_00279 [Serratia phage 4S]|nr:hypothetical protein MYO4S_00279 [Serratia phage 4S]